MDSTFIRSREEGERLLEVRVGNVETASGGRQVFGAVAKADTDLSALIRQSIRAVGRTTVSRRRQSSASCERPRPYEVIPDSEGKSVDNPVDRH
jgi:hypothetical protein